MGAIRGAFSLLAMLTVTAICIRSASCYHAGLFGIRLVGAGSPVNGPRTWRSRAVLIPTQHNPRSAPGCPAEGHSRIPGGSMIATETTLTVSEVARRLGVPPRVISTAFYERRLDDGRCPVVGHRRRIPEDYVGEIAAAVRRTDAQK